LDPQIEPDAYRLAKRRLIVIAMASPQNRDPFEKLREQQEDVLTYAQVIDHAGRTAVRRELRGGRWQQPHPNVVVLHNGPLTAGQLRWVAVLAGPPDTCLAGPTAAALDGLAGFRSDVVHVCLRQGARALDLPGVQVHWSTKLGTEHVHPARQPRRTRLPRSLIDMASRARSDDHAQAILAAGVQQLLVTPDMLREAARLRGRFKRSALVRETIYDLAGGCHSLPEIEFARIIRRGRLPEPTRQRVVERPDGRRYLDTDWDEFGVSAEVHGVPHIRVELWDSDLDRISDLTADGRRVLQFTSYAIRRRSEIVLERLTRALRTGGWQGP
jgi:hypothetical protein